MVQNPPTGYQRIIPYFIYQDAPAAIEFLKEAFGFSERCRIPGPDGCIYHAELEFGGECVFLASANKEVNLQGPDALGGTHAFAMVYVDDVDGHHARAVAAGARIFMPPADQFYGDRTYRAFDTEGVMWCFGTHIKDVNPEDFKTEC